MTRARPSKSLAAPFLAPILVLVAILLAAPSTRAVESDDAAAPPIQAGDAYVPGELIVGYRGEELPETVEISPQADPEAAAERLEDHPGVRYATPNYVARISSWIPDDIGVNPPKPGKVSGWEKKQWNFLPCLSLCHSGASSGPQSLGGMNVLKAWRQLRKAGRPGARGVKVAVLDTGVAYRDYGSRFRIDPDFDSRTFLPGYDFVDHDRLPLDRNGHGTHVSSTIAQATDNRRGLTGIAYGSRVIPVRVMDANGFGTTENIIKGIRWATDHGARVVSMSLNFACGASIPPLEEALRYAHSKGVVLVGSSGNKGSQTCPSLPATSPQVISVGGTTESGCLANYSFRSDAIDIAAPGGGSTKNGCPHRTGDRPILQVGMIGQDPSWYGIESGWKGTSMAAAHVAGAAAMIIAGDALPDKKGPSQVRTRLLDTARKPGWARGNPRSGIGAGIVNLGKAVNPAFSPPPG
ncbi:MAG TPA: S8 family serine peptidase [Solirubrobacterales bacterium]|nr:S8 family serine peptidase [Solirubrobacterales bacterium]